jgi:hypothetical protein
LRRSLAPVVFALPLLASCSGGDPSGLESARARRDPIVHGTVDTTHRAVVAVLAERSVCSGTIVAANGATAWVLTAAHCCDPDDPPIEITTADDYARPSRRDSYRVTAVKPDPAYDGSIHDFCMVAFDGAGARPPAPVPVLPPRLDDLRAGSPVTFSGYGVTSADPDSPGFGNSVREQVDGVLTHLDAWTISYDQRRSGPCDGDSGGPAFYTVDGRLYVAGVTSYGDQDCTRYGVSGRASAAWSGFIEPIVNGRAAPPHVPVGGGRSPRSGPAGGRL